MAKDLNLTWSRRVVLTHAGHDFPSEREDALLVKEHMKKPSAAYQGEAKKRGCLKCCKEFHSALPGGRVCARCKETVEWREPTAVQQYILMRKIRHVHCKKPSTQPCSPPPCTAALGDTRRPKGVPLNHGEPT